MSDSEKLPLSAFMPHHPSSDPHAPFTAKAGKKNNICARKIELSEVIKCIETIYDPEIPVNIYDLGLIYTIKICDQGIVDIFMSLTAPGCPVAGEMPGWVSDAVSAVPGVLTVNVELIWEPQWGMDMMSDEARLELGFM